ncbi:type II toxin-antitoxin system death-on-curing family toxin [Spirosoma soli]|uniref:Type II toxin-antitoxin system death-on-curing family toxin n=1 Tax=Spirosoma soli TaxID=1770529 RepID=A0ABW5M132_9BACT
MRHYDLVASALVQPFATFDGNDLYPTLIDKAALIGYLLISDHPFVDGNKRIGHPVIEVILVMNGFEIEASVDEQEHIILEVADGKLTREQFTDWVHKCVKQL